MTFVKRWNAHLYHLVGWLPFTLGGALFFLVSLMALWLLGVNRSDLIMVIVGVVGVVLSILGLLVTLLAGAVCYGRLQNLSLASGLILMVGEEEKTPFRFSVPWWIPLVQMEWKWSDEAFSATLKKKQEWVVASRRGEWSEVVREITLSDAFGICSIRFQHHQQCTIRVVPNSKRLQHPNMVEGLQAGADFAHPNGPPQGDRIDIRNYAPGDPVRYILWKVYARTGELVVRTPEKAYQPAQKMLAYLIVSDDDEVAAGLTTVVLQGDLLGKEWAFGVDGLDRPIVERDAAISAVIQSGDSSRKQGVDLHSFLLQNQEEGCTLLVFASARYGEWVDRVLTVAQTMSVRVFIGIDGLQDSGPWSQWKEVLFMPPDTDVVRQISHADLQQTLQAFHNSGALLYIADQRSGVTRSAAQFQLVAG